MRLIDANKFTEKCKEIIHEENDNSVKITWAIAYDNFIDEINEQPTVDAVPVVRCKDCKYCEKGVCLTYRGLYAFVSDMEYCSRAERRDSDETDRC